MTLFETGDPNGGLVWLAPESLPTDATPVELFDMDTSRLQLAGPNAALVWAGEAG